MLYFIYLNDSQKNLYLTVNMFPKVTASNSTPVKTSFVKIDNGNGEEDCICLTIGRELFYFLHKAIQQVVVVF